MNRTRLIYILCACIWSAGITTSCIQPVTPARAKRARAFYRIGVKESNKGHYRQALAALTRAAELNPEDYWIQEAKGGTLLRMGFPKKAIGHFKKALSIEPKSPRGWNNLGTAYMATGNWKEAIYALKKSIKNILHQTPCFSQMNLGWAYHKSGDIKNAQAYLNLSIRTCPKICQGHRLYGLAMYEQKQYKKAQQGFEALVKRCAKFPQGYYWLAKSHLSQKQYHAALEPLRECIQRGKKIPKLLSSCRQMMSSTQNHISRSN